MRKRKKIKRYQLKRKYKKFIKAQMERKVLREFYLITEKDANMMSLYLPPLTKTDKLFDEGFPRSILSYGLIEEGYANCALLLLNSIILSTFRYSFDVGSLGKVKVKEFNHPINVFVLRKRFLQLYSFFDGVLNQAIDSKG